MASSIDTAQSALTAAQSALTAAQSTSASANAARDKAKAAALAASDAEDAAIAAFNNGTGTEAQVTAATNARKQAEAAFVPLAKAAEDALNAVQDAQYKVRTAQTALNDAKAAATQAASATPPAGSSTQVSSNGTTNTTSASGTQKTTTYASTGTSTTNPSASGAASAAKMSNPQNIVGGGTIEEVKVTATKIPADAKPSANPANVTPAFAKFKNGDNRVRLIVPPSYLVGPASGPPAGKNTTRGILSLNGGIIFPYTPSISIEHSASYQANNAIHSNYTQYFYKNSAVGEISLTGKFTVQNSFDAAVLLAVQHLCRALTKMPFGDDPNAGSPPPVCRLFAYGDYQLDGAPVAVKSFKMEYPDAVDYFTLEKDWGYGLTSVPIVTSITLNLIPIYSRNEMLKATTTGWLIGGQREQGYL